MLKIQEHVRLSEHCLFRVGGIADYFASVSGLQELRQALRLAIERRLRHVVFGAGSNIFFSDAGFNGLVIRLAGGECSFDRANNTVTAGAGHELSALVRQAAEYDLGGLESLGNIPGSLGGAVAGNAGWNGQSLEDVLLQARILDTEKGVIFDADRDYLEYSHRQSRLKNDPHCTVFEATLQLQPRPRHEILADLESNLQERLSQVPQDQLCAGSFFIDPEGGQPAWKLITDAGLKGIRIGDAMVSGQHANFLINTGVATSSDILRLVDHVKNSVQRQFGIMLQAEVRYVSPVGFVNL